MNRPPRLRNMTQEDIDREYAYYLEYLSPSETPFPKGSDEWSFVLDSWRDPYYPDRQKTSEEEERG